MGGEASLACLQLMDANSRTAFGLQSPPGGLGGFAYVFTPEASAPVQA
jgi:hypothetical protein